MLTTVIILLISAALFVSGKVRSDLVALCALLALLLFQILNPTEALAGFSNTTVIMMVSSRCLNVRCLIAEILS